MICPSAIEAAKRILDLAAKGRGEEIVTADAIACALEIVAGSKVVIAGRRFGKTHEAENIKAALRRNHA